MIGLKRATSSGTMASFTNVVEGSETPLSPQPKLPVVPLLIVVVSAILVSVASIAGASYYMVKTGRISLPVPPGSSGATATEPAGPHLSHALVLEPMVVNLIDDGGRAYLKLGLTLRVEDAALKSEAKLKARAKESKGPNDGEAAVRDTTLEILGHQTSGKLLAPDGKEHLKAELKGALAAHNKELKIIDIYFTEFLIQH